MILANLPTSKLPMDDVVPDSRTTVLIDFGGAGKRTFHDAVVVRSSGQGSGNPYAPSGVQGERELREVCDTQFFEATTRFAVAMSWRCFGSNAYHLSLD
jgi:hypothetical protein